jgi:uncharacterized membrane protein YqjE
MTLVATVDRIGATLVAMVRTRLELAAVEVQEEARRLLGYVAWTLLAVLLVAAAFMLAALFVILLFWDSYRLQAVAAMAILFALAGTVIVMKVHASFDAKPRMLSATLAELHKDADLLRNAGHAHEN